MPDEDIVKWGHHKKLMAVLISCICYTHKKIYLEKPISNEKIGCIIIFILSPCRWVHNVNTTAHNRSTVGSRNHHHQRPQVAKTNREKLQNGKQSTGVHCQQFQVQKQRTDPPIIQIPSPHLEHAVQFWCPNLRRDIDKIEKIQRRATKMISEIRNHSYHQRIQDLDLISLVQGRLGVQLTEMFKYLNRFTTASARGLFDYDLNDRTRNNGAKLIVKQFNTSVAQHFYPIKLTTSWNALPSEVVSSRTVNSFKNSLDKHWAENPPNGNW